MTPEYFAATADAFLDYLAVARDKPEYVLQGLFETRDIAVQLAAASIVAARLSDHLEVGGVPLELVPVRDEHRVMALCAVERAMGLEPAWSDAELEVWAEGLLELAERLG